jgi:hypothetical protein
MAKLEPALRQKVSELNQMQMNELEKFSQLLRQRITTILTDVEDQFDNVFLLEDISMEIELEIQRRQQR